MSLAVLPTDIGVNAQITIKFDTTRNPSESGINGRKAVRLVPIRNYSCTINPADASEVQKIYLSTLGERYPVAFRDWTSYQLTDEPQAWTLGVSLTTTRVPLYKAFTPATGSRSFSQRILVLDGTPVVKINGTPTGAFTIEDPAIIVLSSALVSSPAHIVTVTCNYFTPVCFMDDLTAQVLAGGTSVLYNFPDIRLEEILEAELTELTE